MDTLDDSGLLRRYASERSQKAVSELVKGHLTLVYRAALRQTSGNTHQAEDIAQGAFTLLAPKARHLRRHPKLVRWLYTTTHFVASADQYGNAIYQTIDVDQSVAAAKGFLSSDQTSVL